MEKFIKTGEETDLQIKDELMIADIPVVKLAIPNSESKSCYIGVLNGFIFERGSKDWYMTGRMPMDIAKVIHEKYKQYDVRSNGQAEDGSDFVTMYRIGKQIGLCRMAKAIREFNVHTDFAEEAV